MRRSPVRRSQSARVDHDRAVLARVVAPDAAHEHRRARAVGQRQRQRRPGRGAVEIDDRLADVGGDRARAAPPTQLAGERQAAAPDRRRARDQRRPTAGADRARCATTRCASARTTPASAAASGRRRRQRRDVAAARADAGADVEVGGQDDVEPARHRIAKARHHHRQRDRQGEAGDDAGDGDRRAGALVARALDGEQGERRGAARRTPASSEADAARNAGDAADQQQRDRAVGGERNLEHRRHRSRAARRARSGRGRAQPERARRRRHAEAFQACAGAMRCAERAGSQPPTSAATTPSSAIADGAGEHRSAAPARRRGK